MKSKGKETTIASLLAVIASIAPSVSWLAPFTEILISLAGAVGGVGFARVGIEKVKGEKVTDK